MKGFKIIIHAELDFKDLPEEVKEEIGKMLEKFKTKENKKNKMRIDIEELK